MKQQGAPEPQFERDSFPKMIVIVAIISLTLFAFVAAVLLTDLAGRSQERIPIPQGDDAFGISEPPPAQSEAAPATEAPVTPGTANGAPTLPIPPPAAE